MDIYVISMFATELNLVVRVFGSDGELYDVITASNDDWPRHRDRLIRYFGYRLKTTSINIYDDKIVIALHDFGN